MAAEGWWGEQACKILHSRSTVRFQASGARHTRRTAACWTPGTHSFNLRARSLCARCERDGSVVQWQSGKRINNRPRVWRRGYKHTPRASAASVCEASQRPLATGAWRRRAACTCAYGHIKHAQRTRALRCRRALSGGGRGQSSCTVRASVGAHACVGRLHALAPLRADTRTPTTTTTVEATSLHTRPSHASGETRGLAAERASPATDAHARIVQRGSGLDGADLSHARRIAHEV